MSWIEPVSTGVTLASLASDFAKSSKFVKRHWKRLVFRINHGSLIIPIFGAGGVGKSTMSRLLTMDDPYPIIGPYRESWTDETVDLRGDIPGKLLVAPGQQARVERYWPKLIELTRKQKRIGIVNLVSYGYHSFELNDWREHDLASKVKTIGKFGTRYAEHRRQVEIDLLGRLLDSLQNVDRPLWFLTIVNKQDLWWSDRQKVRRHYEQGEYSKVFDRLRQNIGPKRFQHEILPVSLTLGNFVDGSGQILRRTIAGYDYPTHLKYVDQMCHRFCDMAVKR